MSAYFQILIYGLIFVLYAQAIIAIIKSSETTPIKVFWVIIVIIFPLIGSMIYFQLKKRRISKRTEMFKSRFKR